MDELYYVKFKHVEEGAMFNVRFGRFVKTSDRKAICVNSDIFSIGASYFFPGEYDVVVSWYQEVN